METSSQRSARSSTDDMNPPPESAFTVPTGKVKISARVSSDTKKKLSSIMAIWRAQTRVEKEAEAASMKLEPSDAKKLVDAAVQDVDLTYVVDRLLKKQVDIELAQWGGNPDSPEKLAAVVKIISKR